MSKKRKKKHPTGESHTKLSGHHRQGKSLVPPMKRIPNWSFSSWIDDRLPEMLWAVLIISQFEREAALALFRRVVEVLEGPHEKDQHIDLTLSSLPRLPESSFAKIRNLLCTYDDVRRALRPMLLFPTLPAHKEWAQDIADTPVPDDWETLMEAVATVFDHQSQEATDIRWIRVVVQMIAGRMFFAPQMEETAKGILYYPNYGDQRRVRPSIRASEIAEKPGSVPTEWPQQFWLQCWRDTRCQPKHFDVAQGEPIVGTSMSRIREVRVQLVEHFAATTLTTAVDARHDATFGVANYALAVMDELLRVNNSSTILGRMGLRSLLEALITLSYLSQADRPELWLAYREYGAGQAKLSFLKLDEQPELEGSFVSIDTLKSLANEDRWQEFQDIALGHWDASNLRQMSEKTGTKDAYDRYYPWASAFVHANWAAVRNGGFRLCINPLHRLHRILVNESNSLEDVVPDAVRLTDRILEIVGQLYPGFPARLASPD